MCVGDLDGSSQVVLADDNSSGRERKILSVFFEKRAIVLQTAGAFRDHNYRRDKRAARGNADLRPVPAHKSSVHRKESPIRETHKLVWSSKRFPIHFSQYRLESRILILPMAEISFFKTWFVLLDVL